MAGPVRISEFALEQKITQKQGAKALTTIERVLIKILNSKKKGKGRQRKKGNRDRD